MCDLGHPIRWHNFPMARGPSTWTQSFPSRPHALSCHEILSATYIIQLVNKWRGTIRKIIFLPLPRKMKARLTSFMIQWFFMGGMNGERCIERDNIPLFLGQHSKAGQSHPRNSNWHNSNSKNAFSLPMWKVSAQFENCIIQRNQLKKTRVDEGRDWINSR